MSCIEFHQPHEAICQVCGMITAPEQHARDWTSVPSCSVSKTGGEVLELMREGVDFDTSQFAVSSVTKMTEKRGKVFKGKSRRSVISTHIHKSKPHFAKLINDRYLLAPKDLKRAELLVEQFEKQQNESRTIVEMSRININVKT